MCVHVPSISGASNSSVPRRGKERSSSGADSSSSRKKNASVSLASVGLGRFWGDVRKMEEAKQADAAKQADEAKRVEAEAAATKRVDAALQAEADEATWQAEDARAEAAIAASEALMARLQADASVVEQGWRRDGQRLQHLQRHQRQRVRLMAHPRHHCLHLPHPLLARGVELQVQV